MRLHCSCSPERILKNIATLINNFLKRSVAGETAGVWLVLCALIIVVVYVWRDILEQIVE